MKITDFCPRAAPMDTYLKGTNLTGVEVGCDVGAHAEALLTYCSIEKLHLIDLFESKYCEGYCEGRLARWQHRIQLHKGTSHEIAWKLVACSFDFVYIDISREPEIVTQSLVDWWKLVKKGGVLGYRNYSEVKEPVDTFVSANRIEFKIDDYHNEIILIK